MHAREIPKLIRSLHALELGIRLIRHSLNVSLSNRVLLGSISVGEGVVNELRAQIVKHLLSHKLPTTIKVDVPHIVVVLEHEGSKLLEGM